MHFARADLSRLPQGVTFPLVNIGFSSHALFKDDWDGKGGLQGWRAHHEAKKDVPLEISHAYPFVDQLLRLNTYIPDDPQNPWRPPAVQAHLVSRAAPGYSERVRKSLEAHGMHKYYAKGDHGFGTQRWLGGESKIPFLQELGVQLYLSDKKRDVEQALIHGIGAAYIDTSQDLDIQKLMLAEQLRIALDGDAVIFSDEAEKVYQAEGLIPFNDHERKKADIPLPAGPLNIRPRNTDGEVVGLSFIEGLMLLRSLFPDDYAYQEAFPEALLSPLAVGIFTARGKATTQRAMHTFMEEWGNKRLDTWLGQSGRKKGRDLRTWNTTMFFDDGGKHVASALAAGVPGGHVLWGVKNQSGDKQPT